MLDAHAGDRPNIVIILADDLGYGDISSYGAEDIATPNIDSLAREGIRFTDAYAASSVCTPSRAALLTGRYPSRLGIHHVFAVDSPDGLRPEEITLAEQLKQVGYATGLVGKWHLGHMTPYQPWHQGFDEFYGAFFSNDMPNFFLYENQRRIESPVDQHFLTRRYTDYASKFIRDHRDEPFFLYLAHNMPHAPLYVSPDFAGTSPRGLYGDVVQELDWSVGQILALLDELELAQNTIVIFSSDNGPWLMLRENGGSAGDLRDGKGSTFDGGFKVPALLRWPARIAPAVVHQPVSHMDWFATLSAAGSAPLPEDRVIDGKNLLPMLLDSAPGRSGDASRREFIYLSSFYTRPEAVRRGRWKFKAAQNGYPAFLEPLLGIGLYSHGDLLFDLEEDPGELNNLIGSEQGVADRLRQRLATFRGEMEAAQVPPLMMRAAPADLSGFSSLYPLMVAVAALLLALIVGAVFLGRRLLRSLRRSRH